jgi:Adenylate and Guanylate cyclase catalytic domain
VDDLRNRVEICAEAFDCVTLMFTDLPEFQDICENSDPLSIISFLTSVYSVFDQVTPYFDVYKVEIVNDSYVVSSFRSRDPYIPKLYSACDVNVQVLFFDF